MENTNPEKKSSFSKTVKNINARKAIRSVTFLIGLAMIFFMTLASIAFDPENAKLEKLIPNTLILVGISVFGLLIGESEGEDRTMRIPDGLYQSALSSYNSSKIKILPYLNYFGQYYIKEESKELRSKKISFLVQNNFDGDEAEVIVDNVTKFDLVPLLSSPIEKKDKNGRIVHLCQLDVTKKMFVEEMMNMSLEAQNYSYFLTAETDKNNGKGIIERSVSIPKQRKSTRRWTRTLKIISTVAVSVMWAMLSVKDFSESGQAQAWMNLISRLMSLATAFGSGWGGSVLDVRIASDEIENKVLFLIGYNNAIANKEFIPETYEARYARERQEAEEKERQEAERRAKALKAEIVDDVSQQSKTLAIPQKN